MQTVIIPPGENQNVSGIVLCYTSPNITPTNFLIWGRSLYNTQWDVVFTESISISTSENSIYSHKYCYISQSHISKRLDGSSLNAFCTVDSFQLRENRQVGKHGERPKCTVIRGMIRVHWQLGMTPLMMLWSTNCVSVECVWQTSFETRYAWLQCALSVLDF